MRVAPLLPLFVGSLLITGCSDGDDDSTTMETEASTVVSVAVENDFDTLATALTATELDVTLAGDGPFTVFAPTEAAFAALPAGKLDGLLMDTPALSNVLRYHVSGANLPARNVLEQDTISTLADGTPTPTVVIDAVLGGNFINEARITATDFTADNGVVHVIDTVLTPPTTTVQTLIDRGFDSLVDAVDEAELVEAVNTGTFTIFAPTDEAFASLYETLGVTDPGELDPDLLEAVLKMHLVENTVKASTAATAGTAPSINDITLNFSLNGNETGLLVNGAAIGPFNIPCTNGMIHVMTVLVHPCRYRIKWPVVQALQATDLDETLSGTGPFTVFAPTEAVLALPAGIGFT